MDNQVGNQLLSQLECLVASQVGNRVRIRLVSPLACHLVSPQQSLHNNLLVNHLGNPVHNLRDNLQ